MGTINRKMEERIRKMVDKMDEHRVVSEALHEAVQQIKAYGDEARKRHEEIIRHFENFFTNKLKEK